MATFKPIGCGIEFQVSISNLDRLTLEGATLIADFFILHDEARRLRVSVPRVELMRTADEFIVSVEEKAEGLVREHFAYLVEGSEVFKKQLFFLLASRPAAAPPLKHYAFVTGWTCVDVISVDEPSFSVVDARPSSTVSHSPTPVLTEVGGMKLQGYTLNVRHKADAALARKSGRSLLGRLFRSS